MISRAPLLAILAVCATSVAHGQVQASLVSADKSIKPARMGLQSGQFRLYAGKGNGELCDQCGEQIQSDQVGYELVSKIINVRPMNIHRDCYEDWEARFVV